MSFEVDANKNPGQTFESLAIQHPAARGEDLVDLVCLVYLVRLVENEINQIDQIN